VPLSESSHNFLCHLSRPKAPELYCLIVDGQIHLSLYLSVQWRSLYFWQSSSCFCAPPSMLLHVVNLTFGWLRLNMQLAVCKHVVLALFCFLTLSKTAFGSFIWFCWKSCIPSDSTIWILSTWTTCGHQACLVVECKIRYTCQKHCIAQIHFPGRQRHLFELCPVDFVEHVEIYIMV